MAFTDRCCQNVIFAGNKRNFAPFNVCIKRNTIEKDDTFVFDVINGCFRDAQKRKLERLPYIDQRRIHFGFSVGLHTQDLGFTHTGYTTEAGETWYAEVPSFSPGFNVGLVSDLYLCKYLNLRFCPTMYFGNKTVEFREDHTDERRTVDLKSNYIMIPIDLKYSAKRLNNYCPYITAGVAGAFDISKKKMNC